MKKGNGIAIADRITDLVTGVNLYVGLIEIMPPDQHAPLLEGILSVMAELEKVADETRSLK